MNNQNQVVQALQKFKMDVYANLTSKDEIKNFLTQRLGLQVYSGQKRLVVFDPNNPSLVYKIAYSDQGIMDNILEVAVSNKLALLAQRGQISYDDLELFGRASLIDGDPFIIQMTAATNYVNDPDFISWYRNAKTQMPDLNENQLFSSYVKSVDQLREDHNKLQQILAQFFIPSDVTIFNEPKNFCLRRDGSGRKRLVLIDMGSVCPKLVKGNQVIVPKCEKCGYEKIYTPIILTASAKLSTLQNLTGMHLCRNQNCTNYFGNALKLEPDMTSKDSYVFSKYLRDNRDLVRGLKLIDGFYFLPNRRVSTKVDYLNEVRNTMGINPNPQQLDILFRNYCSYICGAIYAMSAEDIARIPAVNGNSLVSFLQYLNMFNNVLSRSGEQLDNITTRVAGLTYITILTSRDADNSVFDVLTKPDFSQFQAVLAGRYRIDQQNGMALYNAINIK